VRAAHAAHPKAALRDTQAPTPDDQRHVPTRPALAAAVKIAKGSSAAKLFTSTVAAVTACPLVLERPRGPGAAAAPAQPLPVGTWGAGPSHPELRPWLLRLWLFRRRPRLLRLLLRGKRADLTPPY